MVPGLGPVLQRYRKDRTNHQIRGGYRIDNIPERYKKKIVLNNG